MSQTELNNTLTNKVIESWQTQAQHKYATMYALGRIALRLIEVGAPLDVIAWAQKASIHALDHCRGCLGLVAAYGGEASPLKVHFGPEEPSTLQNLEQVAVAVIIKGCIPHTRETLTASRAYEVVGHDVVAQHLRKMAQDGAEDAEGSWKALRWILGAGNSQVEHAARNAFQSMVFELTEEPNADPDEAILLSHGCLTARTRHEVYLDAHDAVIMPAYRAIFDDSNGH